MLALSFGLSSQFLLFGWHNALIIIVCYYNHGLIVGLLHRGSEGGILWDKYYFLIVISKVTEDNLSCVLGWGQEWFLTPPPAAAAVRSHAIFPWCKDPLLTTLLPGATSIVFMQWWQLLGSTQSLFIFWGPVRRQVKSTYKDAVIFFLSSFCIFLMCDGYRWTTSKCGGGRYPRNAQCVKVSFRLRAENHNPRLEFVCGQHLRGAAPYDDNLMLS